MSGAVRPSAYDYGRWSLVVINSAVFLAFAFSFARPRTTRDWRSFGTFSAFMVALFTEMYGFPLTIYLLSGWLRDRFPGMNLFAHNDGMLWWVLLGRRGNPHLQLWHQLSVLGMLMYVRLARREEREARAQFGQQCADYATVTPAFFPLRLSRLFATRETA